jgi:hypothetical protein
VSPGRTLPLRVPPVPGEALDSWLEALARRRQVTVGTLAAALGWPVPASPGGLVACIPAGVLRHERIPFVSYTQGDAPRGLAFAPDTPATRRAGVAGDLFVATINQGAWTVNEVVRISGPFDELIRQRASASP